jgi:hypothetical protein
MNRIRGLGALIALAGLIGGLPWLLLRYGDWPITALPDAEWARRLTDTFVTDRAIFAVLTVAAWAVWATFTFSVLVELAASVRGFEAPNISLAGPLQRVAQVLVGALVVAVTINQSAANLVSAMPVSVPARSPVPTVQVRPTVLVRDSPTVLGTLMVADRIAHRPTRTTQAEAPVPIPPVVTVGRGDSPWSIAEQHLGDGLRWRELWDLNQGVPQPDGRAWTDPQTILVGWQIAMPSPDTTTQSPLNGATNDTEIYVVVKGDTLSEIAKDELGDVHRYPEIFDLSRATEQPGGRHLSDPNLILPGWKLTLPAEKATPAVPEPAVGEPSPETPIEVTPTTAEAAVSTLPPPQSSVPTSVTPPTSIAAAIPVTSTASVPTSLQISVPAPITSAPSAVSGGAAQPGSTKSSTALLAAVGGSIALASGLAIRIGFLRRRRGTNGGKRRATSETHEPDIRAVTRAADVPLVRWAGQELAKMVQRLDRKNVTGGPQAVELSEAAGIEVLWSTPQQLAPEPWQIADGGWAWRLPYDPDAPTPHDSLPAAIPALVTIGTRDGRQLLLDFEAFGTTTVTGPPEVVDSFLRSIAVELAAGQDLADSYVHAVALDVPATRFERLNECGLIEATEQLDGIRVSIAAAMAVDHVDNSFSARVGSPTPLEATVAVIGTGAADEPAGLVPARMGIAVITGQPGDRAECQIEISADGTAHIEPLGITFVPVSLGLDAADAIDAVFEELRELAAQSDDHVPAVDVSLPDMSQVNDHQHNGSPVNDEMAPRTFETDEPSAMAERPAPKMLVKVLGVPSIPDRPDLGRREVIITTILACRGGSASGSFVQDAVWEGDPVELKTVWNIFGATRSALGKFPDGSRVMPAADRPKSRLQLDPGVITDLALLRFAVQDARTASSAEAIRLLGDAIDMVDGPPFDAAGFDWAYTEQLVSEANSLIVSATCQLVPLALAADLVDVARNAVRRALRAIPGDEDLYRCRLRIENHANNPAGARTAYAELSASLKTIGAVPSAETEALYAQLVRHNVA